MGWSRGSTWYRRAGRGGFKGEIGRSDGYGREAENGEKEVEKEEERRERKALMIKPDCDSDQVLQALALLDLRSACCTPVSSPSLQCNRTACHTPLQLECHSQTHGMRVVTNDINALA